jgi:aminobenzoyl-glutamate utilization protein A
MIDEIKKAADETSGEIIRLRRDFHKYPELGFTEFRTASLIARELRSAGCEIKIGREIMDPGSMIGLPPADALQREFDRALAQGADTEFLGPMRGGFTAVAAVIKNGDGPVTAFRVDTDALPIQERSNESHPPAAKGFASVNSGIMHACGHDAHTAAGLGAAKILMRLRDKIRGTVKIIFQPAEELICGAWPVVKSGFLDDVSRIFTIHFYSLWESGLLSCTREKGHFAISKFDAKFTGAQAHAGSRPEAGRDALTAAANAVLNLNAIPRHSDGATRVNVGRLTAGPGRNIICDEAVMELETRGETTALNDYMVDHAMRILKASADMRGCGLEITPMGFAPGGSGDPDFSSEIIDYAARTRVLNSSWRQRNCGSEDFHHMLDHVRKRGGKGAALSVGAGPGGKPHSPDFDINEEVLKDTAAFVSALIIERLNMVSA